MTGDMQKNVSEPLKCYLDSRYRNRGKKIDKSRTNGNWKNKRQEKLESE